MEEGNAVVLRDRQDPPAERKFGRGVGPSRVGSEEAKLFQRPVHRLLVESGDETKAGGVFDVVDPRSEHHSLAIARREAVPNSLVEPWRVWDAERSLVEANAPARAWIGDAHITAEDNDRAAGDGMPVDNSAGGSRIEEERFDHVLEEDEIVVKSIFIEFDELFKV